ncbi:MAG: L-arabinose isomerase family protein [Anaerolineae bacterium]
MMTTRLRVIYAAPGVSWGGLFTTEQRAREIAKFRAKLAGIKELVPHVTFVEEELASFKDVGKLDEDKGEDGILFFSLSTMTDDMILKALDKGLPMILFVEPYSWHVWSRDALKTHANASKLLLVSSTDFVEVVPKIKVVDAYHRLQETKILLFDNRTDDRVKVVYGADSIEPCRIDEMEARFGVSIERMPYQRILDAYESASESDAEAITTELIEDAEWVVEPTKEDVFRAAKLYLAIKKVLDDAGADAVTIDCLAMLHDLPTTPCIAFSLLNDEGTCAACEADLHSLLTMLAYRYLADVPSFISDPVIDTARNSVIHAHCVSATMMDGKNRERYILRNHSESRTGVSPQVKMRVGQEVTVAKFANLETMLASTGRIIANPDVDRGCRTKVEVLVPDARKLLRTFSGGLHRVLAYGNHVESLGDLCRLLGIEMVSEG